MTRIRSLATAEPWRGFFCLLQVILLAGFSIPSARAGQTQAARRATAAPPPSRIDMALASAGMRVSQLQTKVNLAAKAAISKLNPPSEFDKLKRQFEEPLIATGPTSAKEDAALYKTLQSFGDRTEKDDLTSLKVFLSDYPHSAWRVGLLTNLGLLDYRYGYFAGAIKDWTQAWDAGKTLTTSQGKALTDRALAELARMHARLGHASELEALFQEVGDRKATGSATEILTDARDGLWQMRHEPGISFLCGPMALKNFLFALGTEAKKVQFIDDFRSGPNGVTFNEVATLAKQAGIEPRLVYRSPNQPVPMPSIVHWKVNHFAALLGYSNGRYHLQDPTFGTDLWITPRALDTESSGYFLVAQKNETQTWKIVSSNVAQQVRGMGSTNQRQPGKGNCAEGTNCTCSGSANNGLCGYGISEMTVSLNLNDIPVGYTPPIGPSAKIGVIYNQREDSQPATFAWFNVSPRWTLSVLSYIQDEPGVPGANVSRYVAGGGSLAYYGYNSTTKAFASETATGAVLVLTSTSPIKYTRTFPDGHREIYAQSNGSTNSTRLVFLSQIIDPAGNALTFNYDTQLRLTSLTDATGRDTTFSYELSTQPLLVTTITDPFGRSAHLSYDASGRLSQIQDVLGLKSQFSYDSSSLVNAMTKPYGTTTFAYSDSSANPGGDATRWLNVTDPLGHTERMEYRVLAPNVPYSDPGNIVPVGMSTENAYLYYRDSFYWDKHAYAVAAGNYLMARNMHWNHWSQNTSYSSDSLESSKAPLENRVWFDHEGQGAPYLSGTYDKPTAIGRVLDDGTTQLTKIAYNTTGNVTDIIDPVGRETQFIYAANGIDILTVQQKTSASGFSTIAQFTYNTQHLPLTYTSAAGQTTAFAYNSAGQLTHMTDALSEATQYQYDALGYLTTIINANGQTQASFTYNQFGNVATATDSEGYTVNYAYDSFDRVTQQTFPDTTTRKYTYTNLDLTSVTDRQGNTTQYAYDSVRNLLSTTDPLQHVTKLGYWENRSLKSLTDPNGNTTTWNIDVQNRVTAKQYADGTQVTNTYETTTSRLKAITDAMAQVKTFAYAKDDTLANIAYTKSVNATPNVSFAYDPYFRRITSMTDGNGIRNYAYQPVGSLGALQLAKESGPFTNDSIGYSYDQISRLSARTVDTSTETFSYDKLSRLVTHGDPLGTFNLAYLGQTGQITSQQIGTGTVATTWTYEPNTNDRRLKSINNSGATRSFNYTTTPENLITQIQETAPNGSAWASKTWNYSYDDSYRLTKASSGAGTYGYSLDSADNISTFQSPSTSTSATYNNLNQVVNYGSYAYIYDKNGNVLDDGLRTYTWDAENRLLSVSSKTNPSLKTSFKYDGMGRRTEIDTSSGVITATRYLWCGERLCQARSSTDTVQRRYYSEGEYLPLGGTSLYYSQDQLGSVRDVVTAQNGNRVASFDYDPYGAASQSSGRLSTDFRYAALFYDQQDGIYLARNRSYFPITGKWLSREPFQSNHISNLYLYVKDSPLIYVDPLGLWEVTFTWGWGWAGQITFGVNNGQFSLGAYQGAGAGLSVSFDPTEKPCQANGTEWGQKQSATLGGIVDVGGEINTNGEWKIDVSAVKSYNENVPSLTFGHTWSSNPNVQPVKVSFSAGDSAFVGWGGTTRFGCSCQSSQ